jgi:hypothetical protein
VELFDGHTRRGKRDVSLRFASSSYQKDLQSKQPQLVLKVASNITNKTPRSVSESLDYIARNGSKYDDKEYIAPENQDGKKLSVDDLMELKSEWRSEFSNESHKSRVMTHLVLSIKESDSDSHKKLQDATRDFLTERFGDDGFRYCFTVHNDTGQLHAHIMLNNNNLETGRKFRMDNQWLLESRMMASKHLKTYGLNYAATLKRDRVNEHDLERQTTNDYLTVSNWYDAQLKKAARNPEHYKQLKQSREILDLARRRAMRTGKQDDLIEYRQKIAFAKSAMLKSKETPYHQIKAAVKNSEITHQDVLSYRAKEQTKVRHDADKLNKQVERAAIDLLKAEKLLRESPVKRGDKLMAQIVEQKRLFEKKHKVDFDKLKTRLKERDRLSPSRELENLAKKAERSVSQGIANEKAVYRFFDELQTAKNKAGKRQQPIQQIHIEDATARALKAYQSAGIDVIAVRDKWHREKALKVDVAKLKLDVENASKENALNDPKKTAEYQRRIDTLSKRVESIGMSDKNRVQLQKSLAARQKTLNATKSTPRHIAQAEMDAVMPQLKKLTADQKRRCTALRERMLKAKAAIDKVPEVEAGSLHKQYSEIKKSLLSKGVDLDKAEHARKRTNEIKHTIERGTKYLELMRNRAMKADINQLQKAYDDANKALADAKRDPSLNRQQRQDINQKAKMAEQTLSAEIANRTAAFWSNVNKAETLYAEAVQIKKRDPQSISNVERVTGKRRLEQICKEYGKIAIDIKADMSLAGSNDMRQSLMRKVQQMDKTMSRGQERGFER